MKKTQYKLMGALVLCGAVLLTGCPQGNGGKTDEKTPPPPTEKKPPEAEKKAEVLEATRYEGELTRSGETYIVRVSMSAEGVIGITAEEVRSGVVYIGKGKYDEKTKNISADLKNARLNKTIKVVGKRNDYRQAFEVSEFGSEKKKGVLVPVSGKKGMVQKYDLLMKMAEPIGEAVLSLRIEKEHVTAVLVSGEAGSLGAMYGYHGTGYVRRGKYLHAEIPLTDKERGDKKVVVKGELKDGELRNFSASVSHSNAGKTEKDPKDTEVYDKANFPKFKDAEFMIYDGATVGDARLAQAKLTLQVRPVQVYEKEDPDDEDETNKVYKTIGYEMTAWFETWKNSQSLGRSKKVTVRAKKTEDTSPTYNADKGTYTFDFKTGDFMVQSGAGLFYEGIGFKITDWAPVDLDGEDTESEETVLSGKYKIDFSATDDGKKFPEFTQTFANDCRGSLRDETGTNYALKLKSGGAVEARKIFAAYENFKAE